MKLFASIFFHKYRNAQEPWLEPILRQLRFGVAQRELKMLIGPKTRILDFGCGPEAPFLRFLEQEQFAFDQYVGVDPLLKKAQIKKQRKVQFISDLTVLPTSSFDVITMFAVLEHLPYPNFDFSHLVRVLKPGGVLLLTTPAPIAKPILEFLSYKVGIVSRREIEEHTHYFTLAEIAGLFSRFGVVPIRLYTFELGVNNYAVLQKRYRI